MHCVSCAANIEKFLQGIDGVLSVNVNFAAGKAFVEFNPQKLTQPDIETAIKRGGYKVIPSGLSGLPEIARIKIQLAVAAIFSLPLVYLSMVPCKLIFCNFGLAQFLLATVVLLAGFRFFTSGIG